MVYLLCKRFLRRYMKAKVATLSQPASGGTQAVSSTDTLGGPFSKPLHQHPPHMPFLICLFFLTFIGPQGATYGDN